MLRRLCTLTAAAVGITLAVAAPASAWWAGGGSNRWGAYGAVFVQAEPGEQNDMTATAKPGLSSVPYGTPEYVVIHDDSAPVTPAPAGSGTGCTEVDSHTVRCTGIDPWGAPMSVDYLDVQLDDGDDALRIPHTSLSVWLWGSTGTGNDVVTSYGPGGSSIYLDEGDDRMVLRGSLSGPLYPSGVAAGPGDDVLDVVNADDDDDPSCGDGADTLYADVGEDNADCEARPPLR